MKIQCNACGAAEARVLCCADEAALCSACDEEVHAANKLAGKHQRVLLLPASACGGGGAAAMAPPVPKCDICQEASGYFFCLEDRALLCRDCDVAIHTVNPYVSAHQRFLLTGVQVGLDPAEPLPPVADKQLHAADRPVDSLPKFLPRRTPTVLFSGESSGSVANQNGVNGDYTKKNSFSNTRSRLADWTLSNTVVRPVEPPLKSLSEQSPSLLLSNEINSAFSNQMSRDSGLAYNLPFSGGNVSDTLPDWPVDEFFGAPEYSPNLGFAEHGSPKADSAKLGSAGGSPQYHLDDVLNADELLGQVPGLDADELLGQVPENSWAVPEVASPPTASGLYWQGNLYPSYESTMFVPDVSSFQNSQNHFTASVGFKRRRRQF